jgi:hypothetical protein
VALDGRLLQRQPGGDLAVAEGLTDQAEYLPLAVGQGGGPLARPLARVPEALPGDAEHDPVGIRVHRADGKHQLLPVDALEQVAPDARVKQVLD